MPCAVEILRDSTRFGCGSRQSPHDDDGAVREFVDEGTTQVPQAPLHTIAGDGLETTKPTRGASSDREVIGPSDADRPPVPQLSTVAVDNSVMSVGSG